MELISKQRPEESVTGEETTSEAGTHLAEATRRPVWLKWNE